MPDDKKPVTLVLFCKNCNVECYRSVRPLRLGVDKADPSLFVAVGNQQTPPSNGAAICDICQGALVFAPAKDEKMRPTPQRDRPSVEELLEAERKDRLPPPSIQGEVPPPQDVQELFKVGTDETVLHSTPTLTGFILVTNKRVLKITA